MSEKFVPEKQVEIDAGDGIILREFAEPDALALLALYRKNAEDLRKASIYVPFDESDILDKIAWRVPENRRDYCIWDGSEIIGEIDLIPQGRSRAEIFYWLDAERRGQGKAALALQALARHALGHEGYETVTGHVSVDNIASQKTLEKAGFRYKYTNLGTKSKRYELSQGDIE